MSKKILLAGGCSYTDKEFTSVFKNSPEKYKNPTKMWPEHISEILDLEYMNVGRCGADNYAIYNNLLEAILTYGERIDTVMVLWTGWDRYLFMHEYSICFSHNMFQVALNDKNLNKTSLIETMMNVIQNDMFVPSRNLTNQIRNSLFLMYSLAKICESKNIKYLFFQGINPLLRQQWYNLFRRLVDEHGFPKRLPSDVAYNFDIKKSLLKAPVFPHLEKRKSHIIGWPFATDLGGYSVDEHRNTFGGHFKQGYPDLNRYYVSESDRHPSEEGQEIISRYFIERYEELYR